MAKVLVDEDTFTASVTVPEDGDTRNAASVEVPFQALANRTNYIKQRLDDGEWDFPSPITVVRRVPLRLFLPTGSGTLVRQSNGSIQLETNSLTIEADLGSVVPHGATILRLYGAIQPGDSRSGADRMLWELRKVESSESQVASQRDDSTANPQAIHVSSINEEVNKATTEYKFRITAGSDAASKPDVVFNAYVEFSMPGVRLP